MEFDHWTLQQFTVKLRIEFLECAENRTNRTMAVGAQNDLGGQQTFARKMT